MPLYEYECYCGKRLEKFSSIENRHNVVCDACGRVPRLLISKLSSRNPYQEKINLTVVDGEGNVVGVRHDHHRTPPFHEFHSKEVLEAAQHGQEVAYKEMLEEAAQIQDGIVTRQPMDEYWRRKTGHATV